MKRKIFEPIIKASPMFPRGNPKYLPQWLVSVSMPNCKEGYCKSFGSKKEAMEVVAHWKYWMPKAKLMVEGLSKRTSRA